MIRISSRDNPSLKRLRSLKEKKYRQQCGMFMIEGRKLVQEALASGKVRQVFLDEDSAPDWAGQCTSFPEVEWYLLERGLAAAAASTVNPPGIAAVAVLPDTRLEAVLAAVNSPAGPGWMIYLDRINDPGNLGSILRSAWALGVEAALLSPGCADPFNPKAVRAASGAVIALPVAQEVEISALALLVGRGYSLLGADVSDGLPYYMVEYGRPAILAIGSEAHGLESRVRELCAGLVRIPMPSGAESLNAAAAASIILADYARRYIGNQSQR